MRILSQDGKFDFPYERICLEVSDSGKVFAQGDVWGTATDNNYIEVANYSTEAKARKAMEMLHDRYTGKDETVFEIAHIKRSSTDNFYFQFPYDDEVEAWQ